MAIRTNCIEYGWETDQGKTPSGSQFTSITKRIFIPEVSSRTFQDVILQYHARNDGRDVTTLMGAYTVSIQIDNNPSQSFTTQTLSNSNVEQISFSYYFSASAYFQTYFTSSTHNVTCFAKNITGPNSIGQTFKLISTYAFDDANTVSSIKTVRLPIGSITASALTTKEVYLGNYTASIPALDTYLPEISKSYKDIFIEYHSNDASTATTNFNLKTRIDTNASASRFTVSQSLQTAAYYYDIQSLTGSIDTATTHSIRVASNLTNRFTGICGILTATYEYDYTGSTTILNSNIYSLGEPLLMYGTDKNTAYKKVFYIPEDPPINLKRSGAMLFPMGQVTKNLNISTNSQSFAQYPMTTGTIITGVFPILHQIDGTGSAITTPISLNTGSNEITIYNHNIASLSAGGHVMNGGILFLNYESSVGTNKPLEHTKTIITSPILNNNFGAGASSFFYNSYTSSLFISESRYYISDLTNYYIYFLGKSANIPIYSIMQASCFYSSSDAFFPSINPLPIGTMAWANGARFEFVLSAHDMTNQIIRFPGQLVNRNNPKIDVTQGHVYSHRNINVTSNAIPVISHLQYLTYYSKTFPITGSITNYSGSGAGIPITVYDYDSGQELFSTQSLVNGNINTSWYDRHTNLLLIAETGSRYLSNVLPAGTSGSFLITIPSSAPSGGEKSFTFVS